VHFPVNTWLSAELRLSGCLDADESRLGQWFGPSDENRKAFRWSRGGWVLDQRKSEAERREWVRLPLAIPVFVRSRDQAGKDFLEFATALNISAGGALVAVHRSLRPATPVSLEIPSAPLAASAPIPKSSKNLRAKIVRVTHAEGYHLLGLKFNQPILNQAIKNRTRGGRKFASSV